MTIQRLHEARFNFTILGAKITNDVLLKTFRVLPHGESDLCITEVIVE